MSGGNGVRMLIDKKILTENIVNLKGDYYEYLIKIFKNYTDS